MRRFLALMVLLTGVAAVGAQEAAPTLSDTDPFTATDTPMPVVTDTPTVTPTETATPSPAFPTFYGGTEDALVRVNEGGEIGWTYPVPGGVYSIETAGDGSLLAAGGEGGVFLVARRDGDLKVVWDWKKLGFKAGDITCAVAADRDPNGRVSLVLAAEPAKNRIFLAEARSNQAKVRWEFQTLLPPRQVGVCPDGKHFWVLCSDGLEGGAWSLEEIDFKNNKSDWTFDPYQSAFAPSGFIRTHEGWNLLVVPGVCSIATFLKDTSRVWQSSPLGFSAARYIPVALCKDWLGGGFLASYTPGGSGGSTRMAFISATDGEEVTSLGQWSEKGAVSPLPAFRCLSPGPAPKKKKTAVVQKTRQAKGAKSAVSAPKP